LGDLRGKSKFRYAAIYRDIVPKIAGAAPQAVLVAVTDPPDPLADYPASRQQRLRWRALHWLIRGSARRSSGRCKFFQRPNRKTYRDEDILILLSGWYH
jgi:hypothetical protein